MIHNNDLLRFNSRSFGQLKHTITSTRKVVREELTTTGFIIFNDTEAFESFGDKFRAKEGSICFYQCMIIRVLDGSCLLFGQLVS
jgi:hypothetical protein